jgi:hypothetical protein
MDDQQFDALTRRLGSITNRRSLLGAVATALLGRSALPESALACKKVGKKCDKTKDCCDGARCKGDRKDKKGRCRCKGGRKECGGKCKNLDTDEKHCGSCNNSCPEFFKNCVDGECLSCLPGADHCESPPSTPGCEGNENCFCLKRLEDGVARCGQRPFCDEPCEVDADCVNSTIPNPNNFCASAGDACCPGLGGQGRCALPCDADI